MAEETSNGSSLTFIFGLLWSILAIVVPGYLWTQGMMPDLMFGAMLGASVRLGTDLVLMAVRQDGSADGVEQFAKKHMGIVVLMVVIQFGTLVGALAFWLIGGDIMGLGYAGIMILTYIVGALLELVFGGGVPDTDDMSVEEDDEESEWKFDVDDV